MKQLMGLMIYGGIFFGLSAGGAWYMHSMHQTELAAERSKHEPDPDEGLVEPTTRQPTVVDPEIPARTDKQTLAQVPVRPESMSVEEIVRHGMKLKERDASVRAREESLQRLDTQFDLMRADIEAEQLEIEGLVVQAREYKQAAETLLKDANAKRLEANNLFQQAGTRQQQTQEMLDKASHEQQAMLTKQPMADAAADLMDSEPNADDLKANIRQLSDMLSGMEADAAAKMLTGYIDNGDMDIAVQLVSTMEPKKSAGILEAMSNGDANDGKVDELLQEFARMKRPKKMTNR